MKLGGKNKQKSKVCDRHNWNESAVFGIVGGRVYSDKLEKNEVF